MVSSAPSLLNTTSAVVYLVREVLYDPDLAEDNANADHSLALHPSTSSLPDGLSETPKASDGFATLLSPVSPSRPPRRRKRQRGELDHVVYGRDFALKCLCKRDLSDELLLLQRGEAELHRALPLHKNIVALHRVSRHPRHHPSADSSVVYFICTIGSDIPCFTYHAR